jgi:hypothetical protein
MFYFLAFRTSIEEEGLLRKSGEEFKICVTII